MVAVLRPQPDAGSVIQPEPPFPRLLRWHFQPLPSPQPFHALVVHMPASISQQGCDPTVAVATILARKLDHVRYQALFVSPAPRQLTLCRAVLAQHPASTTFRDAQLVADKFDTSSTTGGAQKFPFAASARISLSSVRSDTAFLSRSFSF